MSQIYILLLKYIGLVKNSVAVLMDHLPHMCAIIIKLCFLCICMYTSCDPMQLQVVIAHQQSV